MLPIHQLIAALIALVPLALVFAPGAAQAEKRIALVVGNAGYQAASMSAAMGYSSKAKTISFQSTGGSRAIPISQQKRSGFPITPARLRR